MKKIFVLGAGRTGTKAFARWMNSLPGVILLHEWNRFMMAPIWWHEKATEFSSHNYNLCTIFERLKLLETRPPAFPRIPFTWYENSETMQRIFSQERKNVTHIGDAFSCYLPYIEDLMHIYGKEAHVIVLDRTREKIVDSWNSRVNNVDQFRISVRNPRPGIYYPGDSWTNAYPDYPQASRRDAISLYVENYYARCNLLRDKYPERIDFLHMNQFDCEDSLRHILKRIEYDTDKISEKQLCVPEKNGGSGLEGTTVRWYDKIYHPPKNLVLK